MKKFLLRPATAIALFSVMMCFVMSFSSCTGSSNGRKDLVKALFSDYTAEVEFLFECDGNSVAGTARVTRDENVRNNSAGSIYRNKRSERCVRTLFPVKHIVFRNKVRGTERSARQTESCDDSFFR